LRGFAPQECRSGLTPGSVIDHEASPRRLVRNALVKRDGRCVGLGNKPAQMRPFFLLSVAEDCLEKVACQAPATGR